MQIKITATGQTGNHTTLFPQTSFPTSGPSVEWLKENGCEEYIPPVPPPYVPTNEERIAALWQAAHDYEYNEISGSAVGLLAIGVMQQLPKCLAVQSWIKSIWTEYYTRKFGTSASTDYSVCGPCPHSVPELMAELGL